MGTILKDEQINQIIDKAKDDKTREIYEAVFAYLETMNEALTNQELKQFLILCKTYQMNPLKREIYAVKYGGKFDVITNYNEYLKRADATGLLEYYYVDVEPNQEGTFPIKAVFVGKRKDQSKELRTTLFFREYSTGKATWMSKPFFMLEKCALAKGIRLLFPNELGNMPYVNEEYWKMSKENNNVILENIKEEETKQLENKETSKLWDK